MIKLSKKNFFELLNIDPTDDLKVINKAYRQYLFSGHPDKGGDLEVFLFISSEREKLQAAHYRQQFLRETLQGPDQESFQLILKSLQEMHEILQEMRKSLQEMRKSLQEMRDLLQEQNKQLKHTVNDARNKKFGPEWTGFSNPSKVPVNRAAFFTSGTLVMPLLTSATSGLSTSGIDDYFINQVHEIDYSLLFMMIAVSSVIASALLYVICRSCHTSRSESVNVAWVH